MATFLEILPTLAKSIGMLAVFVILFTMIRSLRSDMEKGFLMILGAIKNLDHKGNSEIKDVRGEIKDLKHEMAQQFKDLEHKMDNGFKDIRTEMKDGFTKRDYKL